MSYIKELFLDDGHLASPNADIAQERKVAIRDLLEENSFSLPQEPGELALEGPFELRLSRQDKRIVFDVRNMNGATMREFSLAMGPLRQIVKDYFQICESYFSAVKSLAPSQIETIDMARRGIHNEAGRELQERLEGKAQIDSDTARRLFTLICVLHIGA